MASKRKPTGRPPTYLELAALVADLTEINIANLDSNTPSHRFVTCFTYGANNMPKHWQRAIDVRELLIVHRLINRSGGRSGQG